MTIKEIMQMTAKEINALSERELTKVTQRLVDASNKKAKRMEQANLTAESPAYTVLKTTKNAYEKDGADKLPRYSTKTKTAKFRMEELKNIFSSAKAFLQSKTSTLKGARQYKAEIEDQLSLNDFFYYKDGRPKKSKLNAFWKAYNRYKSMMAKNYSGLYNDTYTTGSPPTLVAEFFEDVYRPTTRESGKKYMTIEQIEEALQDRYIAKQKKINEQEASDKISSSGSGISTRVDAPKGKKKI